jgi:hypothetical protein
MGGIGERLKRLLRGSTASVEDELEGSSPAATPPPGAHRLRTGDGESETSTNAQAEGAADEPWPGNS